MSGKPPIVEVTAPSGLDLDAAVTLPPHQAELLHQRVVDEVGRYPTTLNEVIPRLHVLASAVDRGTPIRARYFPAEHVGVLTPTLDLRGNVHRIIASAMFDRHAIESQALIQRIAELGNDVNLYEGSTTQRSRAVVLVAARCSGRATLLAACRRSTALALAMEAIESFLAAVGISERHLADLEPPPPYAYLTRLADGPDGSLIQPGDVPLTFAAPPIEDFPDYTFQMIDPEFHPAMRAEIPTDLWPLPEDLVGSAMTRLHLVEDVSQRSCAGLAGFASSRDGGRATVVVERIHRRAILYHEMGHAVHARYRDVFPRAAWDELASLGGGYYGDSRSFINGGVRQTDYSPPLLRRGFITSYAGSELVEDVAEMFEALISGDARLWAACSDSPLIARKLELLLRFLRTVEPCFTEDYFQRLLTERPVAESAWRLG